MTDEPEHVAARIQRRLAEDPRTHELGIHATMRGDVVYLHGEVAGEQRRRLVAEVAGEAAEGREVRNEVSVLDVREPSEEEPL